MEFKKPEQNNYNKLDAFHLSQDAPLFFKRRNLLLEGEIEAKLRSGGNALFKVISLDLDGTLLRSDKSISDYTLGILEKCKEQGKLIAISTARGESNALQFIAKIKPDLVISSSGALVSYKGKYIYDSHFSVSETRAIIDTSMKLTKGECEITIDTLAGYYWNYNQDPNLDFPDWGRVIYTDYKDFQKRALKICVELDSSDKASRVGAVVPACKWHRFSDGDWYQFTKNDATKEKALQKLVQVLGISLQQVISFGDDLVDLEMLKLSGKGVAMENAIAEVREIADDITKSNDQDGVALYLAENVLKK